MIQHASDCKLRARDRRVCAPVRLASPLYADSSNFTWRSKPNSLQELQNGLPHALDAPGSKSSLASLLDAIDQAARL